MLTIRFKKLKQAEDCPLMACNGSVGPLWTGMDWHGPVWTGMDQNGPLLTSMDRYKLIWTDMNQYELVWAGVDRYDSVWTDMIQYGPLWTGMNHYGLVWTCTDRYKPVRTGMNRYGLVWTCLDVICVNWLSVWFQWVWWINQYRAIDQMNVDSISESILLGCQKKCDENINFNYLTVFFKVNNLNHKAAVTQSVEMWLRDQRVTGSSPTANYHFRSALEWGT